MSSSEQTIAVVRLHDFEDDREAFCHAVGESLRETGFLAVEAHGITDACFSDAYQAFERFFALDASAKVAFEQPDIGRARGYTSFGVEHAKDSKVADLKEFFHVGREVDSSNSRHALLQPNIWPEIVDLRKSSLSLYAELDRVARVLLEALSVYLELDPQYFPRMIADGNTVQRYIHYPGIAPDVPHGAMRAAAHEDINLMTLLPPSEQAGLQLLRDDTWVPIHAIPGQIIADTGDMMSRVTNGVIPATTHRVVNPDDLTQSRYSMPFFVHPHMDAILEVLPQCLASGETAASPIGAHAFLMQRLRENGVA